MFSSDIRIRVRHQLHFEANSTKLRKFWDMMNHFLIFFRESLLSPWPSGSVSASEAIKSSLPNCRQIESHRRSSKEAHGDSIRLHLGKRNFESETLTTRPQERGGLAGKSCQVIYQALLLIKWAFRWFGPDFLHDSISWPAANHGCFWPGEMVDLPNWKISDHNTIYVFGDKILNIKWICAIPSMLSLYLKGITSYLSVWHEIPPEGRYTWF